MPFRPEYDPNKQPPHQPQEEYLAHHLGTDLGKIQQGRKVRAGLLIGIPLAVAVIMGVGAIVAARVPAAHSWSHALSITWQRLAVGAAISGATSLGAGLFLLYHSRKETHKANEDDGWDD